MIIFRLLLIASGVFFFVALVSAVGWLLPCPSLQPPPGLASDFFNTWSVVVFIIGAIYVAIPLGSFQLWSGLLGPVLALTFAFVFAQGGSLSFALFLMIQCGITIFLGLVFNMIAMGLSELLDWSAWTTKLFMPIIVYVAATGWGLVQAIGFSRSLC